ncbi:MAG TPA: HEAT repeat domain-containing protein [Geobacteraceae bacterium]|nr:HEAT repeat domain-containing protein [Geobacteraceae bacterium]
MSPTHAETIDTAINRQQASKFVAELIVSRRHIQSYPQDHPAVSVALHKTIASLSTLVARGGILNLGVSRQGLLLQHETLSPEFSKFREFADVLSSFGIISISFSDGLIPEEIISFCTIINRPRSEVWEEGGIKHALMNAGIIGIRIQVIDPSVFNLTDDLDTGYQSDPWEIFVRKLLDGYFSVPAEKILQLLIAPPEELAREFGDIVNDITDEAKGQLINSMAGFFLAMAEQQKVSDLREELFDKIAAFIAGMPPKLRGNFIQNICKASESMTGFSEELLTRIPGDAFLEAMQYVATHDGNLPEMLVKLMQRLSSHSDSAPDLDAAINAPGGAEKVRVLLKESTFEEFVPPAYQKALMSILATDTLPVKSMEALEDLQKTLDYDHLEGKIGDIIFEIIKGIPSGERGDGIRNNLMGLASHHLMNGDFHSLDKTCRIIIDEGNELASAALFDPGFIQEVLDAASMLGRDRFQDIRSIICTVGQPFVEPLMERLFSEENRSMRRFWFDCLGDLGETVRTAAMERLNDDRWFVVRNLIIMLRAFSDPEVQRQIKRLVNHPNSKVSKEAIKSLLSYGDPAADRILLQDLESSDPERKLVAVQIAEMSSDPKVVDRLLVIIESSGIRDYGLELKKAAVQTLAQIGDPRVLPKLKEILFTARLLHPGKHAQLKISIIRALPKFPALLSGPLLEEIAANGGKSLASEALEALKALQGYAP